MTFRVLQIHSEYTRRGGEETAVDMDAEILRAHGDVVWTLVRKAADSNAIEMTGEALGLPIALGGAHRPDDVIESAIATFKPDVVHLHHWQRWGPRAWRAIRKSDVAVVATAHSYRHWCPAGIAHRNGMPCNDCMGRRFPWPAIKYNCWHGKLGSTVAALGAAQMDWSIVDHWIAVSGFVRDVLIEAGIAADNQITVRYGSAIDSGEVGAGTDGFALAVCPRDRPEKGLAMLLEAWSIRPRSGRLFAIGAETPRVLGVVGSPSMSRERLMGIMSRAAFVIVPSIWYEPCPTVAIEALSRGTPVLATRMGGLSEIIDERCGWTVAPTAETLSAGIGRAFREAAEKRAGARAAYLERFTPERSYPPLMEAYGKAQAAKVVARGATEALGVRM